MDVHCRAIDHEVRASLDVLDDPLVVEPGGTTTVTDTVDNAGVLPSVAVYGAGSGVDATPESRLLPPRGSATVGVEIAAPGEEGPFERSAHEHHYLAVLPPSLVVALHGVHPWLATTATASVAGGAIFLVGRLLVPADVLRIRSSARSGR